MHCTAYSVPHFPLYAHTHTHMCACTYYDTCKIINACTYMHAHTRACTHTHTHTNTCVYTHTHEHAHSTIYTHTHILRYIHTHAYTITHTHTYTALHSKQTHKQKSNHSCTWPGKPNKPLRSELTGRVRWVWTGRPPAEGCPRPRRAVLGYTTTVTPQLHQPTFKTKPTIHTSPGLPYHLQLVHALCQKAWALPYLAMADCTEWHCTKLFLTLLLGYFHWNVTNKPEDSLMSLWKASVFICR